MTIAKIRSLCFAACLAAMVTGARAQAPGQPNQPPQVQQGPPAAAPAQAAPAAAPQPAVLPGHPLVPLQPLIDRVARDSKKQFLLDGRVPPEIYLAGVRQEDVTYPLLLAILRANGFGAVEVDGRVNVMPDTLMRFFAPQIGQNDDSRIAPDQYVTRVVATTNIEAPMLVPILRPMLSQAAHLAALPPTNSLIIMDRYANVQRITAIVKSLDQPGASKHKE